MAEDVNGIGSGTLRFRPKARLLYLLGHELIADEIIALVELVKNCYDADATEVSVGLTDVMTKRRGRIEIRDDGHGMPLEVVKQAWMEPARDNKRDESGERPRTRKFGRLPLGEKGVGRFSADKLGLHLELITRSCEFHPETGKAVSISKEEVVLIVEGRKFTEDSYLDEIECEWTRREPAEFLGEQHGTLLRISDLREPWAEELVEKARLGLARLSSPLREAEDFEIVFSSNEFPELSAKVENPLLEMAPWLLEADIDENGMMSYFIKGPESEDTGKRDLRIGFDRFLPEGVEKRDYRKPACGPFKFKLYAFERDRKTWKEFGMDKPKLDLLNSLCGINIYRDNFRVMPYGEPGDDWLSFDRRRVLNPGKVLGNDRVIGYVEISSVTNPYLRDKTNREGLIEQGNAFADLRELTIAASDFLGMFRHQSLPRRKRSTAKVVEAKEEIELGTTEIEAQSSRTKESLERIDTRVKAGDYGGIEVDLDKAASEVVASHEATGRIRTGASKLLEELGAHEDHINNIMSLSGIGMTAERMTHELSKAASNAVELLRTTVKMLESGKADSLSVKRNIQRVQGQLDVITDHIHQMTPLYYSRRRSTEELDVAEIAGDMKRFYAGTIRDLKIDVKVVPESKLEVEMNRGHLLQVFNNLFDNSFFWIEHTPQLLKPRIIMKVTGKKSRTVVFADNGPGVDESIRDHIFDPFVSAKPGGRGLGLYIIQDILQNYGAEIELMIENKLLEGANFRIKFPEA